MELSSGLAYANAGQLFCRASFRPGDDSGLSPAFVSLSLVFVQGYSAATVEVRRAYIKTIMWPALLWMLNLCVTHCELANEPDYLGTATLINPVTAGLPFVHHYNSIDLFCRVCLGFSLLPIPVSGTVVEVCILGSLAPCNLWGVRVGILFHFSDFRRFHRQPFLCRDSGELVPNHQFWRCGPFAY